MGCVNLMGLRVKMEDLRDGLLRLLEKFEHGHRDEGKDGILVVVIVIFMVR